MPAMLEVEHYAWKTNVRIPVKPNVVATEFQAMEKAGVKTTPSTVVERATPADSPLHDAFEWDNTEAAKQYREQQAAHMIRSLVVVYRKPSGELTQPIRAMVKLVASSDDPALDPVSEDATEPRVYLPIRQVQSEPELMRRHLRQAWKDLCAWRDRYRHLQQFADVVAAIDRVNSGEFAA